MIFTDDIADILVDLRLPFPPSDNNLVRLARLGAYPTNDYREWLRASAPLLDDARSAAAGQAGRDAVARLRAVKREPWYEAFIHLHMGTGRRDGQNYEKALFDLLSGKRCETDKRSSRLIIDREAGIWPDDSMLVKHSLTVAERGLDEPYVTVTVALAQPPIDLKMLDKVRPRCTRRYTRMVREYIETPCMVCHAPCVHNGSPRGALIVPGPCTVTAVVCANCADTLANSTATATRWVTERPDLLWEFCFSIGADGLYTMPFDMIWE